MNNNKLIIEQKSPYDVTTTVAKLVENAGKKEWQIPAIHNLQQSLAKSGKEIRAVQVIEICKPEYSGKMLEKNHEMMASVLMPCRISVYEKEDGLTYIALMNAAAMLEYLPSTIAETMQKAFEETNEIIVLTIS